MTGPVKRKHPHSFDFYVDDFVAGTMGMHPCARGIYVSLLCHQWSHGSVNPTNIRQLVQITGAMPDELDEHLDEVLIKFEERENGRFVNARLESEYAKKAKTRDALAANGSKGGKAKANAKQLLEQLPE